MSSGTDYCGTDLEATVRIIVMAMDLLNLMPTITKIRCIARHSTGEHDGLFLGRAILVIIMS